MAASQRTCPRGPAPLMLATMKINHVALWTGQLETLRDFYAAHFGCTSGPKYTNQSKGFSSYFLSFPSGARLELMSRSDIQPRPPAPVHGYAHIALSLGSEQAVRDATETLRSRGVPVVSAPRHTGDGCYESAITDPDGNIIELTI